MIITFQFTSWVFLFAQSTIGLQQSESVTVHGIAEGPKEKASLFHGAGRSQKNYHRPQLESETLVKIAQPTGRPSKNETAAEATGVAQNAAGDLAAFIAALVTNTAMICIFFVVASVLRQRYPLVYSKNALTLIDEVDEKEAQLYPDLKELLGKRWEDKIGKQNKPKDTFFGWWGASTSVTVEDIIKYRGLDQAMLVEFSHLAMKILTVIGLPMLLIVGPCHCFCGGYRAGDDYLSYWGMANVVDGHPWLYWAHAVILWIVIITVNRFLFNAMRAFLGRRKTWLEKLPAPRSVTVLVEGIRPLQCSDSDLEKYFNDMFDDRANVVQKAYVLKDTSKLLLLTSEHTDLVAKYEKAAFKVISAKGDEKKTAESEVVETKSMVEAKRLEVDRARKTLEQEASRGPGGVNLTNGFVTFNARRHAELAKMMVYTNDAQEFVVSSPPDPSDIIYHDLTAHPTAVKIRALVGYALIAGVFWAYLPTVVSIAYFTSLETLAEYSPVFASMAESPSTSALWDGMVNALALQLFIAFVPTFFVLIFSKFFVLKAEAWLQQRIQEWYFYFLVTFVLLVTAIGSSLLDTMEELAEDPTSVFALLASTLPLATHFYLNYLPLQWVTHAQNLMRLSNLFKFKTFALLYGDAAAVKKCEPEDQDYYGLGSRSARFTFMLTLTLSFCSLSPLITLLGFINFWMCRKVYGYLVVFCETEKPDLGGVFYVSQLAHVSQGMFIYIVLMTGVLLERNLSMAPGLIAASGLVYQYMSYAKFKTFRWESLCLEDLRAVDERTSSGEKHSTDSRMEYVQPEMKPLISLRSRSV